MILVFIYLYTQIYSVWHSKHILPGALCSSGMLWPSSACACVVRRRRQLLLTRSVQLGNKQLKRPEWLPMQWDGILGSPWYLFKWHGLQMSWRAEKPKWKRRNWHVCNLQHLRFFGITFWYVKTSQHQKELVESRGFAASAASAC